MQSQKRTNKLTSFKLVTLTFLMFGFGFSLIPFYNAICEATGINILAAKEKSMLKLKRLTLKGLIMPEKDQEFDSNTHGLWTFEAKILRDGAWEDLW